MVEKKVQTIISVESVSWNSLSDDYSTKHSKSNGSTSKHEQLLDQATSLVCL